MSEKLKPCPFCGSNEIAKIKYASVEPSFAIRCKKCCAHTEYYANEIEAVNAWNRRDIIKNVSIPISRVSTFIKSLKQSLENGTLNNSDDLEKIARSTLLLKNTDTRTEAHS